MLVADDRISIKVADNGYIATHDNKDTEDKDGYCKDQHIVICNTLSDLLAYIEKTLGE
jgi:hypothetical protein